MHRVATSNFLPRRLGGRTGIATIEFVLSLPFLFVLMAMIYTLGLRTLHQAGVSLTVRNTAWLKRSAVEGSQTASQPFVFSTPMSGSAHARQRHTLRVFGWLGGRRRSADETILIAGAWDHRQVPELQGSQPHASALAKLGVGGASAIEAMARLLAF